MKPGLAFLLLICVVVLLPGCRAFSPEEPVPAPSQSDFGIYLPAEEISLWQIEDLEGLALQEDALINTADILSYALESHEIRLRPEAAARLQSLDIVGRPFIVRAAGEPVYAGEFMAAYMSRSSEHVVILWPLDPAELESIRIQLGYPNQDFFRGQDPRSDPRVVQALRQAGVLSAP